MHQIVSFDKSLVFNLIIMYREIKGEQYQEFEDVILKQ